MASNRADVVKVPLPPNVGVGLVVGRGGTNTRWLHIHSGGAHITVNDLEVIIRSKDAQVRSRAVQMVQRQLEAMMQFGVHDALSPCRLDYVLLESSFGSDPRICFAPRNDEVAAAVLKKDKLFELVPVPPRRCYAAGVGDGSDATAAATAAPEEPPLLAEVACWVVAPGAAKRGGGGAAASPDVRFKASGPDLERTTQQDHLSPRDQDRVPGPSPATRPRPTASPTEEGSPAAALRFHVAASAARSTSSGGGGVDGVCPMQGLELLAPAARTLAAAARSAAAGGHQEPQSFEALKMRFHLGKHLFRNLGARAARSELSAPELEGGGPGRGEFQSVFSNFVPASAVPRVISWLTGCLGFSLVDTKTSATLHVINQELNVHYSISLSMDRWDDSTASLRKVKAGGSRCHSVALLAAPHQLDLRLRLVAQSAHRNQPGLAYGTDAHATARRVAAAVRTEGFEGFTRSKRGLPRNRHLEYARRKTKFVYEGCFPMQQQQQGGGGCGQRLRVSVTQVQDDKGTHYEISGCLPEVDIALRQMLAAPSPPPPQHQVAPAPPAAEPPVCFVPEWRRGRSSGGGSSTAGGGDRRLYDSASSSPVRAPVRVATTASAGSPASPPAAAASTSPVNVDAEARWAVVALAGLSDFITQLNRYLEKA